MTRKTPSSPMDLFVRRALFGDGCWEWTGYRNYAGYGMVHVGGRQGRLVMAHRLGYELFVGPIPTDTLDHLCRNRGCVRPDHLEPVTRGENVRRGDPALRGFAQRNMTHCKRGHPFDEFNTISQPGGRACRTCKNDLLRQRRAEGRWGAKRQGARTT